jgi:hypothetical protein
MEHTWGKRACGFDLSGQSGRHDKPAPRTAK